jgi:hypothetical protein
MEDPETHPLPPEPDPSQLRAEIDSLRHLVVSLLILLIVISGTLNIYLLRQWRTSQTELKLLRGMVDQYNKEDLPQITNYVAKLTEYGRTHTNFVPILQKYGLNNAQTSPPPATATPPPAKTVKK